MNQEDFKKLLDEALEPIKETQKEHSAALEVNFRTFGRKLPD